MSCHGARNYFKYGNSGDLTSMAYQSICKGATYSLAYVGTIYDTTQRAFPEKFFKAINNGLSISDAVNQATEWVKGENWWWWTFFGQFNDDFKNPILYKKGDSLKTDCGNGNYDNDKKKAKSIFKTVNQEIIFIDNTNNDSENVNNISGVTEYNNLNVPYVFKTTYGGNTYELGFNCDNDTGKVKYYNLTLDSLISAEEFENMMGEPTESVKVKAAEISVSK